MPAFPFTTTMTANGTATPLVGWQYEFTPWPCTVKLLLRSTGAANNVRCLIASGSQMIQPESPVQVGGTAGVTPAELNTPAIVFRAPKGDRLQVVLRETAGATPVVDGIVYIEPLFG